MSIFVIVNLVMRIKIEDKNAIYTTTLPDFIRTDCVAFKDVVCDVREPDPKDHLDVGETVVTALITIKKEELDKGFHGISMEMYEGRVFEKTIKNLIAIYDWDIGDIYVYEKLTGFEGLRIGTTLRITLIFPKEYLKNDSDTLEAILHTSAPERIQIIEGS